MSENKFDIFSYAESLSSHHLLFYKILELSNPIFTDKISTAAIEFNKKNGKTNFYLNKSFFDDLNHETKKFTLAHEALHILLEHGWRSINKKENNEISNIAQDIVINEMLISEFGFNKKELNFKIKICFVDTVFSKEEIQKHNIKKNYSYDYYYSLLLKLKPELNEENSQDENGCDDNSINGNSKGKPQPLDSHNGMEGVPSEVIQDILTTTTESFSNDDIEKIKETLKKVFNDDQGNNKEKGLGSYGNMFSVEDFQVKEDKHWTDLVKKKISSLYKKSVKFKETFSHLDRRYHNLPNDMFVPSMQEMENEKSVDKYNLYFYLDTSGSCIEFKDDFFNLVKTIPQDKFNIHLFCFDDRVYEVDIKNMKVYGGGGTSFGIIEQSIQKTIKEEENIKLKDKYPDLVFVLTDGYGDNVYPVKPENWYWLLTPGHTTNCIPKKSKTINLNELKTQYNIKSKMRF